MGARKRSLKNKGVAGVKSVHTNVRVFVCVCSLSVGGELLGAVRRRLFFSL